MTFQLVVGSMLMLMSIVLAGMFYLMIENSIAYLSGWLRRAPHSPKLLLVLSGAATAVLGQATISVWIWASAFRWLDLFPAWEPAVYFALTCFTTLGFGDVLLPPEWQLLGGLAATNGMLNFGFTTAVLVETMRYIRKSQIEAKEPRLET